MAAPDENLLSTFGRMPARAKLGALVGAAAVIAALAASWLWTVTPDYRPLYGNVSDRDGGAILAALAQMNIPYKFADGSGTILVPAGQVHDARLRLASQGLPKGSVAGFELMEAQKIGVTQFQEQVNYQRALEGELARSIQALSAVQAARVHLAIPKPSIFLREQNKPTASVLVALHPGRTLERAQVAGIVHLVSSSVPELAPRNVSVLDQAGNLLSQAPGGADGGMEPAQLAYVQQIENATIRRILDILEPIYGRGQVRAQVSVDVDFSVTESTAETFKPNQAANEAAIRSQQLSEAPSLGAAASPGGVPGAVSNQPGAQVAGSAQTPVPVQAPPAARKDMTVNYEVDRTVRRVRSPTGTVRRLSAAVVINHRRLVDAEGKVTSTALTEQEIAQANALVRDAVGFSQARGDSLNVAQAPFNVEGQEPVPELPLWKQPENVAAAKDFGRMALFGLLALYLLFGVLRPFLRQLAAAAASAPVNLSSQGAAQALPAPGAPLLTGPSSGDRAESVRQLAKQEPKLVANVVRSWVSKE